MLEEDFRSAFKDAADDIIFYNKYSTNQAGGEDESDSVYDEEEFDNGYYF